MTRNELEGVVRACGLTAPMETCQATKDGTIYAVDVPTADALAAWTKLRARTEESGFYPVLFHGWDGVHPLGLGNEQTIEQTLRLAEKIELPKWFKDFVATDPLHFGSVEHGDWDASERQKRLLSLTDYKGRPTKGVRVALVPTRRPWEVTAWFGYGAWNYCPAPEEHVAVHKYWHAKYGAEIVLLADDIVEMRVPRPPSDREVAEALAFEQFAYSGGDLVFQGTDTLLSLASRLVNSRFWYFWWD